jgi:hypothetical protein
MADPYIILADVSQILDTGIQGSKSKGANP